MHDLSNAIHNDSTLSFKTTEFQKERDMRIVYIFVVEATYTRGLFVLNKSTRKGWPIYS